jgi:uncharacterized phage protein (TIGR02216 family)
MYAGLGVLRLPPSEFWAATPREIAAAFAAADLREAPGRGDLDTLMQAYPDRT